MSKRDPIFALIEKQRRLEAEHEKMCTLRGLPESLIKRKRADACRAAGAGLRELVNTTPTTVAGARAVLWYVSTELGYGQDVPIFGVANV